MVYERSLIAPDLHGEQRSDRVGAAPAGGLGGGGEGGGADIPGEEGEAVRGEKEESPGKSCQRNFGTGHCDWLLARVMIFVDKHRHFMST